MSTISLSLDEIFDLAKKTLLANGCENETVSILSDLIGMLNVMVHYRMVYLDCQPM